MQGILVLSLAGIVCGCATSLRTILPGPVGDGIRRPVTPARIRVALKTSVPSATVKVVGPGILYDNVRHRTLRRFATLAASTFSVGADGTVAMNGASLKTGRLVIIPDAVGSLWINDARYRGKVEIIGRGPGSLAVVNTLGLEEYLLGVVPKETFPSWPKAALRTQAVAARSFAIHHYHHNSKKDYDIIAPAHQLYGGMSAETPSTTKAIFDTEGQYLVYKGAPLCTFFYTCCGGKTEEAANIFPDVTAYPPAVDLDYCQGTPHYAWTYSVALDLCAEKLKRDGKPLNGAIKKVAIINRFKSGRVGLIRFSSDTGQVDCSGEVCRRILGYNNLKSTLFKIRIRSGRLQFSGRGWGHGVGMCQWGSKGMADKGYSYEAILTQYYHGAELKK